MCNFLKVAIYGCVVVLCLSSCADKKLQYLGYTGYEKDKDKWDYSTSSVIISPADNADYGSMKFVSTSYFYYGSNFSESSHTTQPSARKGRSNNYGLGSAIFLNDKQFKSHSHYYREDSTNAVFCPEGYISESDINELQTKLQSITKRTLHRMLASMKDGVFLHDEYSKAYGRILSNGVKGKIMAVKVKSIFTDLGGWQMLKPTEGLDNNDPRHPYKVEYKGDEWYEITAPQIAGSASVCVKVGYAGKYFNSIITGLKNEKMSIDVSDTDYDTSYNNKMLTFTPFDDISYTYMYMKFLCPIVYKEAGNNGILKKADFDRVIKKVTAKEEAFVHEFYDRLINSGNNIKKIQKTYRYQMARYLATKADEQIKKKDFSVDMFLPCSYEDFTAGYDVEYLGTDTYKVTARKGGKSVFLKVVLYGKKQTPAIMGMINPAKGIDYCPDRFMWSEKVKK